MGKSHFLLTEFLQPKWAEPTLGFTQWNGCKISPATVHILFQQTSSVMVQPFGVSDALFYLNLNSKHFKHSLIHTHVRVLSCPRTLLENQTTIAFHLDPLLSLTTMVYGDNVRKTWWPAHFPSVTAHFTSDRSSTRSCVVSRLHQHNQHHNHCTKDILPPLIQHLLSILQSD